MDAEALKSWIPLFGSGGAAAIGVYLVWHLVSKNLPKLQEDFRAVLVAQSEQNKTAIKDFLETLKSEREAFRAELALQRASHEMSLARVSQALDYQNRLLLLLVTKAGEMTAEDLRQIVSGV